MANKPVPYHPLKGHYDEAIGSEGQPRLHWQPLFDSFETLGKAELGSRWEEARRTIRDHGMTFTVQQDHSKGTSRLWPLDPVPWVMHSMEWEFLARGVIQRARMMNALLADVYGPQRILRESQIPGAVLYSNPYFMRGCHGIEPPGGTWVHSYAVDLARSSDGYWSVIGDRTETPTGAGFALENRLVTSRFLPEAFEACKVKRLAGFFRSHRRMLSTVAPGHKENPRIVVLTPGPESETYFEDAFLARYLGHTLVEGADLAVRDRRVCLKTLGGLLPVDMILRREESDQTDSLEFGRNSARGVPGLLDAVRAKTVAVANAIGSGLAESPALIPFLPGICKLLLGEDMLLPTVTTWWCGEPGVLKRVLSDLSDYVVKPAIPSSRRKRFVGQLSTAEREALAEEIRRQPHHFVAQERIPLSTIPVRVTDRLSSRYTVLRMFAIADGASYQVMPGGLARVSWSTNSLDVSVASGGRSKDVWISGEDTTPASSLLPSSRRPVDVSRATFDLPSRIAEYLFWFGRYAERVDAGVRLIRAVLPVLAEETPGQSPALAGAINFLSNMGYHRLANAASDKLGPIAALEQELRSVVTASGREAGFAGQVRQLRHNAWLLRDRLSADAWRIVNRLESDFSSGAAQEGLNRSRIEDLLDRTIMNLASLSGAVMEGMTRGHGWRLLDMGRRMERALQMVELLRHGFVDACEDERARIEFLLEVADSALTYRSRYLTSLQVDLTIDLLLLDEANPRAVAFQLLQLRDHVAGLPESGVATRHSAEFRLAADALAAVQLADLNELAKVETGRREVLEKTLDRISTDIAELSDSLARDYLTHTAPFRQLSNL